LDTAPATHQLHAAGGATPPSDVAEGLRRLASMPAEAIAKFWQALAPCLRDPRSEETGRILDVFCSAYRLAEDDLAAAIRACRFLIEGGVRLDLPAERLGEDIDRLCPEAPEIKVLLLAGYEPIKAELRQIMLAGAIADHGNLLVGAQWRVDIVDSTDRGARLGVPVVMLTLHYREGRDMKRITLQALPDMMGRLKEVCDQVVR
jgi:hypothetical protein